MSPFEQYLISLGYKRYRKIYKKKQWVYEEDNEGYSFSTMSSGDLDYRYILNDVEIIWGLDEHGKPPSLVWPNPFKGQKPVYEDGKIVSPQDLISRYIKEHTPEQIYKFIL